MGALENTMKETGFYTLKRTEKEKKESNGRKEPQKERTWSQIFSKGWMTTFFDGYSKIYDYEGKEDESPENVAKIIRKKRFREEGNFSKFLMAVCDINLSESKWRIALSVFSLIAGGLVLIPLKNLAKFFLEFLPYVFSRGLKKLARGLWEYADHNKNLLSYLVRFFSLVTWGLEGIVLLIRFFGRTLLSPISGAVDAYRLGAGPNEENKVFGVALALGRFALSIAMITVALIFCVPMAIGLIAKVAGLGAAVDAVEGIASMPTILPEFFGLLTPIVQNFMPLATVSLISAISIWSATIATGALTASAVLQATKSSTDEEKEAARLSVLPESNRDSRQNRHSDSSHSSDNGSSSYHSTVERIRQKYPAAADREQHPNAGGAGSRGSEGQHSPPPPLASSSAGGREGGVSGTNLGSSRGRLSPSQLGQAEGGGSPPARRSPSPRLGAASN